jgi:hypothetical protein
MKTLVKSKAFMISLVIVILAATFGITLHAWADEAPPRQVQESVSAALKNNKRRSAIQKYVVEDKQLEADNAKLVGRMEAFGWTMDWSKGQAVKLPAQKDF